MYELVSNILFIPAQNANSSVTQACVAILILSFVISLHSLFSFFSRVFSVK